MLRWFAGALTIRHVDAGSCNGCELEIHAMNNPYYNLEGLGIRFVASPRHADMLLVTGPVSRHMEIALRRTYDATPEPQAGGRRGRLRLHRRHLRRELCELRPRLQRHPGRCRRARLPADAARDHAGHPDRDRAAHGGLNRRLRRVNADSNMRYESVRVLQRLDSYEKLLRLDKPIGIAAAAVAHAVGAVAGGATACPDWKILCDLRPRHAC